MKVYSHEEPERQTQLGYATTTSTCYMSKKERKALKRQQPIGFVRFPPREEEEA